MIEVRMPVKGDGESKASLTGKVAVDTTINSIALDSYGASPVILKGVKRSQ